MRLQCCLLQCGAAPSRPPATPAAGRCLARMFSATRRRHVAPAGHARSPAQGIVRHCCFSAVQLVCLRCPAVAVGVAVGPRGYAARRLPRIGPDTRLLPYTRPWLSALPSGRQALRQNAFSASARKPGYPAAAIVALLHHVLCHVFLDLHVVSPLCASVWRGAGCLFGGCLHVALLVPLRSLRTVASI